MKFELHQNSLFAILLRSKWWVSVLIALGVFGVLRLFMPWGFGLFAAAPFIGIALYTGWKELRRPGAARIAKTLERARGMSWEEFRDALEAGFRRLGGSITRGERGADLMVTRDGHITLVSCKRWKAMRTGIEPLKEFDAATSDYGFNARAYVAIGEVTDNARAFAAEKRIRLLGDEDLATLLG